MALPADGVQIHQFIQFLGAALATGAFFRWAAGQRADEKGQQCLQSQVSRGVIHAALVASMAFAPAESFAVSGGGKDFSGMALEGQDFSGQKLRGKEFRGSRGANADFKGADLASTSFFQADLSNASFAGADLTGASLEEAGVDGADFSDAVCVSSYFTRTISDAKNIKGADFSEAIMPEKTLKALCDRPDATGTNSKTGVQTRESLMCPE
jgi:uncharacterized protein YjbI with pentapeptide repeats